MASFLRSDPRFARSFTGRQLTAGAALLLTGLLAGCDDATTPTTTGVDALLADYRTSLDEAEISALPALEERAAALERSGPGDDRAVAAYVAGLAAYRLGAFDDAERHLLVAGDAGDAETAALATATLGLVRRQQGRPADAATMLEDAYDDLPIRERARAANAAADAHAAAGDLDDARDWTRVARTTPSVVAHGGFSLQTGAFRERARAERAARDAAELPGAVTYGDVRVHSKSGVGGTYFVVQIGRFATRQDAKLARRQLGRIDMIVADAL